MKDLKQLAREAAYRAQSEGKSINGIAEAVMQVVLEQSGIAVTGNGRFFILIPEGRRCDRCGQPEGVQLHVSRGYSAGSGYEHTPGCPTLRCEHARPHSEDCDDCEALALVYGTDETCGPCCSDVHEHCEGSGCICDHAAKGQPNSGGAWAGDGTSTT